VIGAHGRAMGSRHGWAARGVALVLSWVIPATTVWSAVPLGPPPSPLGTVPLPAAFVLPPLADPATRALAPRPAGAVGSGAAAMHAALPLAPMSMPAAPSPTPPPAPVACERVFFGPERFVRTNGPKNEYLRTVSVPTWIVSPYLLRIQNGEPNGTYRVSSGSVQVNGSEIAGTSDFNQNVPGFERQVTLTPITTLKVVLASKPTSYLTINLCGTGADRTPPRLSWTAPATGGTVNDDTPALSLSYQDLAGTGEPGASGVDLASLAVTLDGVDRTGLFTKRPNDASAEVPSALSQGPHRLVAALKDVAGNSVQAVSEFVVDTTPPTVEVVEPARGAYLPALAVTVRVTFSDAIALDPQTLEILVDGTNRTDAFARTPAEAVATLTLSSGPHEVVARIRDKGGNPAVPSSTSFNLDTTPPVVTIAKPEPDSRHGTVEVEAIIQYRDDQALDLATFRAELDGAPVSLGQGPEGAMGRLGPLSEDPQGHTLVARIKDRAGNEHSAQTRFWVDTTVPDIQVVQPPPGFLLATATPTVVVAYSDTQGVVLSTFRLFIDDVERSCVAGAESAICTIPESARLAEGGHAVRAVIEDVTGLRATTSSSFTVDTIAPTGAMVSPAAITPIAKPVIKFEYDDGGTGVAVDSVAVRVDGQDRTSWFARGAKATTGVPSELLSEGVHQVVLTFADAAGNTAMVTGAFTVDTVAPTPTVIAPAHEAFLGDATPTITVSYADGSGTGVDAPGGVRIHHRAGDDPETEITSLFEIGAGEAVGTIPESAPLADGTHHLRVEVVDRAGNLGAGQSLFVLDTVAPTYAVVTPSAGAFVGTRTPGFLIRHEDDRSGVHPESLVFKVDATDLTARLSPGPGPTEVTAVLQAGDALAEGRHVVSVALSDRAGNAAVAVPHDFVVDTTPPEITALVPAHQGYFGVPQDLVRVTYADTDAGAGNGVGHVEVRIDDVVRTAEFTVGPTQAEAHLVPPLGEGPHTVTVTVLDWANNPATASASFFVDESAPTVAITAPAEGSAGNQASVEVTGTVSDADPALVVECRRGSDVFPAVVPASSGERSFTCTVLLQEGDNAIVAVARDRFGRETATQPPRRLVLDRVDPQVVIEQPGDGVCTAADALTVTGLVTDASIREDATVTVTVDGISAPCTPTGAGACAFGVSVPAGSAPQQTLRATALDAAGNTGTTSVTICVDRDKPTVSITQPTAGSYHRGPVLTVQGTVSDSTSPTAVEVSGQPESAPSTALARTFLAQVPVADGPTSLTAIATDAAGNTTTSAPVVVTVDSVPPQVTFTAPAGGTVTREASILVTGTVSDPWPHSPIVTFERAGQPVPLEGGQFAVPVPLPAETLTSIAFRAVDAAGNETVAAIDVLVDRTAPQLTIVSPVPGQANVIGALPLVVQGLVEDATETRVTVATPGVEPVIAARTANAWQASVFALSDGPHELTVTATDAAGNTVSRTVKVFVDLLAPQVTITAPAPGTLTRGESVAVEGEVRETGRVSVTVNGGVAAVERTATDRWHFSATVSLQEGTQAIVAVATDGSGRTDDDQVSVTRDSTAPVVTLSTPTQVSRGKPGTAVAMVLDPDVASIVVRWGAAETTCTASPCTLALTVPEGVASGTTIPAQASATDFAGNVGTAPPRGVAVVADGVITGQVLSDVTGLVIEGATVRMVAGSAETSTTSDEDGRYSLPTGEANAVVVVARDGHTSVQRELAIVSGTGTVPVDARLTPLGPEKVVGTGESSVRVPPSPAPPTPRQPAITLAVPAGALPADGTLRLTALSAQGLPGLLPLGWAPLAAFDLRTSTPPGASLSAQVTFAEGSGPSGAVHFVRYDDGAHSWQLLARDVAAGGLTVGAAVPQAGAYAFVVADETDIVVPDAGETLAGVAMVPLPSTATSTGVVTPSAVAPTGDGAKGLLQVQSTVALPSGTVVQAEVHETYTLRETDSTGANKVASTAKRRQDILLFRPSGGAAGSAPPLPSPLTLSAEVPITPSRTYGRAEILKGEVVLDILSGREGVRGSVGGSEAVDLVAGDVRMSVPAGALAEDTALSVEVPGASSDFVPSLTGLEPLAEVWLDFSGKTLSHAATLSVGAGSVVAGDTVLVAQVERALTASVPRLAVVAIGVLEGDRVVTRPHPALPGIVEGGQYVFYRSGPVGFIAGTAVAGGSLVRALIEPALGSPWPFIALSRNDGRFTLTVPPGPVTVRASVPSSAYAAAATVTAVEGETTPLDLALVGGTTTIVVTPPHGTRGVPVNVPFEVRSSVPLRPETVGTDTIRLFEGTGDQGEAVTLRVLLAQDRRTVSVVPVPPPLPPDTPPDAPGVPALAFETSYTLQVTGLKDTFGADIPSLVSTFTTRDDRPEARDFKNLVLSVPDANGLVSITAPAGTFIPGSTLLVVNSGNGFVLTLTAGNDGELSGELEATVADRLLVTITDPDGHATTFEKSQFYDAATGASFVSEGGGVIEGPEGVELRIPEGALDKPVQLRISPATEAQYQEAFEGDTRKPDLPATFEGQPVVANFGRALKIEASDETRFKKEVDLAFPLPEDLDASPTCVRPPEGTPPPAGYKPCAKDAFFHVFRRIEGPCRDGAAQCAPTERTVFFQALDTAAIEGDGATRKVVTASYPWTGYKDGWTRWDPIAGAGFEGLGGAIGAGAIGAVAASWAIMMWTYTALLPGAPVSGVISGKVLRPTFKAGQTDPVYEGVAGVKVQRDDGAADADATVAFTDASGQFTFDDPHFTGGTEELRADYKGQVYKATAFAVQRSDTKIITDSALLQLVHAGVFRNIATANITLPAETAPPPAPQFGIHVMKETEGQRAEVSSVIAGTPLLIGFTSADASGALSVVTSATINGQPKNVVKDTAAPAVLPMNYLLQDQGTSDGKFIPPQAGSYTVTATAVPPFGPAVTEQRVFRVLAPGGNGTKALPGAPGVISFTPKKDARGVAVTVFPQVTFSEPVTNVAGNVSLAPSTGPAPTLKLAGVGVDSNGEVVVLDTITPTSRVTSLTIEPIGALKYGETYKLVLTDGIEDLDKGPDGEPTPSKLVPFTTSFETFAPEGVGESKDPTQIVGLGVMDDRAYALETDYTGGTGATYQNGILHVYNIEDPQEPRDIPPGARIIYPPRDLAVLKKVTTDEFGTETTTKLVALAASSRTYYQLQGELIYYHEIVSTPANVFIYNVDDDANPREVGAVSLTQNILDGYPWRITMDGNSLFAATARKGIQVVSLSAAMDGYEEEISVPKTQIEARRRLFSGGYRMNAVVQTIPMSSDGATSPVLLNLYDLKVGHVELDGTAARLVFATGSSPSVAFVMVNPDTTERIYQGKLEGEQGSLSWGSAIAFGPVAGKELVLVGGIANVEGGSGYGVAVVDVSIPRAFKILGWVKIPHTIGDIVIKDAIAIVSGDRGSTSPDGKPGVATLINLSDPTRPFVSGTLAGVGSRMALAPNNILLSTERDFLKSEAVVPLNGVKTATLGNLALVEGTDPGRIVVGEGPRSAEDFKLKLRVIPKTYEVSSAKVEFRVGDQTIGSPAPVTMADGRGELPYKLGYTFLKAGQQLALPVLVINEGTPEELISGPRPWNTEQPEVDLVWADKPVDSDSPIDPKDESVTADLAEIDVQTISAEWARRYAESENPAGEPMRQVDWAAVSPPASMKGNVSLSQDGLFGSILSTFTVANQTRSARASVKDVLLGRTSDVVVEPGLAAQLTLTSSREALPADDKSETTLTVEAKDAFGNLVADGTIVVWEMGDGTDGELLERKEATQDGVATARYKAGTSLGMKTLRVRIGDAVAETTVRQVPLGITLTVPASRSYHDRTALELQIEVVSQAGPPADGAPVSWFASIGRMVTTQEMAGGVAKARWDFARIGWRPRVDFVVMVGEGRAQRRMQWTTEPVTADNGASATRRASGAIPEEIPGGGLLFQLGTSQPVAAIEPMVIAGDRTADGTVPFERADGSFEDVPVKASATYRVTGLMPGEHVSVRLGSNRSPNVPPVAHWTGDQILDTVVPDLTGVHDGTVLRGVTMVVGGYAGQAFHFDGTTVMTVPHDAEFAFPGSFLVQVAVKPPPGKGAQKLLEKEGDYRLELVTQDGGLRARFTVQTAEGPQFITSVVPVPEGSWSLVSGRYDSGRLWVGVDNASDFQFLGAAPVHSQAELQIGGGFEGDLDEVRLFDLTRGALSAFANGQQAVSFVADASGTFETSIVSTGQLAMDPRTAAYYDALADARLALAQDDQAPATDRYAGGVFTEAETFWEDRAESATSNLGYVTAKFLGFFAKFGRGVFVGSGGDGDALDPAVLAGDILGSFFLAPVAIARDIINAVDRLIRAQATGADALDLAVGIVSVAGAVVKGKLGVLLKTAKIGKLIARNGKAGRVIARLLAFEARLVAGAEGVSRIKKIVEVANLSYTAGQFVGGLLDLIGDQEESVAHLNTILENAENPNDPEPILAELQAQGNDIPADAFRLVLAGYATPYDEGSPAADIPGLLNKFLKPTKKTLEGGAGAYRALRSQGVEGAFTIIRRIVTRHKDESKALLDGLADLTEKVGPAGLVHVARMARRLGSNSPITRAGQRFVMQALRPRLAGASAVRIEQIVEISLQRTGKQVRRFYDFVARVGGKDVHFECKNWSLKNWTPFPPRITNVRLYRAYRTAKEQFLRDLTQFGADPSQIRWILPKEFMTAANRTRLVADFTERVNSPTFRRYATSDAAYRTTMEALGATFDASGKRLTGATASKIGEIFLTHP
jgi:hypothetical protein